ncbi:DNA polymerase III subunit chi [Candidatus Schmidhempelia bombi]|jgi:DNA polymerase III subunit chi|uniref:DNA polymerase III subunit chi n=1 Tax=Candidatus Schmidhempelia bombi str. Bimp TaxID=1387197 RepID=A0AB94IBJ3_9GAMM|nr:DNA polymerase III subunit chi [Candidatus Schmidhempelia bombi]TEA26775.1 DNA polymerase III subunit chi [Candidatus Schmidhempelia bombi str. Bimp]
MKKVLFYLFSQSGKSYQIEQGETILAHEYLACQKALIAWQKRQRVLIACQSQIQAEKIDEFLWQLDTAHFLPHNLAGEGPRGGAPVEICWPERRATGARQLLINLQEQVAEFSAMYQDIIDFVPFDEAEKQLARERYKAYKNIGFHLKTIPVEIDESESLI